MRALATRAQATLTLARLLREFPSAASRPAAMAVARVGPRSGDEYSRLSAAVLLFRCDHRDGVLPMRNALFLEKTEKGKDFSSYH
jgi:hypothetical protein